MDAEEPDLPARSFDAALCRWVLMFLPHLVAALTRLRALLVPDGRFAAAVWGSPEKVPFTSVPMGVIRRWSARLRRRVSLRWRSNARRSPSNTPRSRNSLRSAQLLLRASASCLPRLLPPSAKRSGRWSHRRWVSIRTRPVSYVFRLKPSVWWAKREATRSTEPRVGPDRRLAFARRGRSTRTFGAQGNSPTCPRGASCVWPP